MSVALRIRSVVAAAVVLLVAADPAARAQEPTVTPSDPVHRARVPAIEEVVVTARRREETLQDVPVTVTAITGENLNRYNAADLGKIAQMTPQLLVDGNSPGGAGGTLTMRGIGSSWTSAGFEQAVSMDLDGVPHTRGNVLSQGYFDLKRVEVLKGPQVLFFGKSSTAGVVSLTSEDPGPEREWIGRYGHEFYGDEHWFEAIGSGLVTETFGARIALRYGSFGGFIDNTAAQTTDPGSISPAPSPKNRQWPGKDEFLGRITLTYNPIEELDVKIKFGGTTYNTGGNTQALEMFSCAALGFSQLDLGENCRRDWKIRQTDMPREIAAPEPLYSEEGGALYQKYHAYNLVARADYHLGIPLRLTSVTGYSRFGVAYTGDYDFTETSLIYAGEDQTFDSVSEELRLLTSFDFPLNVMVGGYFQRTRFELQNVARILPVAADPATGRYVTYDRHSPTDGQAESVFGQLTWNVTETIELAPGARYTHETKNSFAVNDYVHPATAALWRPAGQRLVGDFSDANLSPEVTLRWTPQMASSDLSVYGAYKTGFKSGGFSNSALLVRETRSGDALFKSEKVTGYEGGIKSTWLDRAFRLNFVAYSYDFKDLQLNFFDSRAINFIVQNAAAARTTGTEVELQWIPPIEGLELNGSFSYNRARYGNFLAYCYTGQSFSAGCNLDEAGAEAPLQGVRQDLKGAVLPLAPEWTAAAGLLYERVVAHGIGVGIGADSTYSDHYVLNPLGRKLYQNSFFRPNVTFRVFDQDEMWEVSLFGRNLLDEWVSQLPSVDVPLTGAGTGTDAAVLADQVASAGRGREFGIQITGRF